MRYIGRYVVRNKWVGKLIGGWLIGKKIGREVGGWVAR
jgi:hypothetical protein